MDWHEQHTLLKAAFSTTIPSDTADFDTQWGRVSRATHRDTDFDAALFEVHESVPLRQQVEADAHRVGQTGQ